MATKKTNFATSESAGWQKGRAKQARCEAAARRGRRGRRFAAPRRRPTATAPQSQRRVSQRKRRAARAPRPSRWPPSSATSRSASSSPRTATCWASTIRGRRCSPRSRKRSTTRSTPAKRRASCPEIWVHVEQTARQPLQGRRAGQRPGHRQEADSADLRQAAVRLEVSPPAAEPRAAGHRHQRRRHVRHADDRQAGEDHLARSSPKKPAHYFEIQIDTKRNEPKILNGKGEGVDIPAGRQGRRVHREARHRVGRHAARHARDDRAGSASSSAAAAASTSIWSRRRSPIRTSRCTTTTPKATRRDYLRSADKLPPEPKEIQAASRTASSSAGWSTMLKEAEGVTITQFLIEQRFRACQLGRGPQDLRDGEDLARAAGPKRIGRQEADALYQAIQNDEDRAAGDRLHLPDRRGADPQGTAPGRAGRVLLRGDAAAGRVSRQSVLDRGRPGLRRRGGDAERHARTCCSTCSTKPTPARCGSF